MTTPSLLERVTNKTFKSTYQILKEISEVWDDLSDISRANVTELLAGKRQGNILSALMTNFDIAEEVADTSANRAQGSAQKELENFQKGIEYSLGKFRASFQEFSTDFITSDLVKGIVDFGTGFVNVLDMTIGKLGALKTVIAGLGIAAYVKNFMGLKAALTGIPALLSGLPQIFTAIKSFGLEGGLQFAEFGLGINTASIALASFIAVAGGLYAVAKIIDKVNISADEALEAFNKQNDVFEGAKTEVENLNSELEETQSKIDALESKSNLSLVEQEDLNNLKKHNAELKTTLELREAELKIEARRNAESAHKLYEEWTTQDKLAGNGKSNGFDPSAIAKNVSEDANTISEIINRVMQGGKSYNPDTFSGAVNSKYGNFDLEQNKDNINELISAYKSYQNQLDAVQTTMDSLSESEVEELSNLDNFKKELTSKQLDTLDYISEYASVIQSVKDSYTQLQDYGITLTASQQKELLESQKFLNEYNKMINNAAKNIEKSIGDILDKDAFSDVFDKLAKQYSSGQTDAMHKIIESNGALMDELNTYGITPDQLVSYVANKIDPNKLNFDKIRKQLEKYFGEGIDSLSDEEVEILYKYVNSGSVTLEDLTPDDLEATISLAIEANGTAHIDEITEKFNSATENSNKLIGVIDEVNSALNSQATGSVLSPDTFNSDNLKDYRDALEAVNGTIQYNADEVRKLNKEKVEAQILDNEEAKTLERQKWSENAKKIAEYDEQLLALKEDSEEYQNVLSSRNRLANENNDIVDRCNYLDLYNQKLRESVGAYQAWLDAQSGGESGDMSSDVRNAIQAINNVFDSESDDYGKVGTHKYEAALEFLVPEDVDKESVQSYINKLGEYFNGEKSGVDKFVQEGIDKGLMEYDPDTQELSIVAGKTMQDFADAMMSEEGGWTMEAVQAMFGLLDDYTEGDFSFESLFEGLDKTEVIDNTTKSLSDLYDELKTLQEYRSELDELGKGGNVDLNSRPVIDAQKLNEAGYDAGEGLATVFSSTFSNEAETVAVNFTPILPDGTVMEKGAFEQYCQDVVDGVREDTEGLQIGVPFTGDDAIQQAEEAAEQIHNIHENMLDIYGDENTENLAEIKFTANTEELESKVQETISNVKEKLNSTEIGSKVVSGVESFAGNVKDYFFNGSQDTSGVQAEASTVEVDYEPKPLVVETEAKPVKIEQDGKTQVSAEVNNLLTSDGIPPLETDVIGNIVDCITGNGITEPTIDAKAQIVEYLADNNQGGVDVDVIGKIIEYVVSGKVPSVDVDGELNLDNNSVIEGVAEAKNSIGEVDGLSAEASLNAEDGITDVANGAASAVNSIPSEKTVTIKAVSQVESVLAGAGIGGFNGTAHVRGTALANGSWGAKSSATALVGELGREIVVDSRTGKWHTVGDNGAEFTNIKRGDIVFNHKQTEELLARGFVNGRGSAFAWGTAYQTGVTNQGVSGTVGGYNPYSSSTSSSNANTAAQNANTKSTKSNTKETDKNTKSTKKATDLYDWVAVRLKYFADKTKEVADQINDYISSATKTSLLSRQITANQNEIGANQRGADLYLVQANKVAKQSKMSKKLINKAQTGAWKFEKLSDKDQKKVQEYLKYYDKYQDAQQKVRDLRNEQLELYEQWANMPAEEAAKKVEKLTNAIKLLSNAYNLASSGASALAQYAKAAASTSATNNSQAAQIARQYSNQPGYQAANALLDAQLAQTSGNVTAYQNAYNQSVANKNAAYANIGATRNAAAAARNAVTAKAQSILNTNKYAKNLSKAQKNALAAGNLVNIKGLSGKTLSQIKAYNALVSNATTQANSAADAVTKYNIATQAQEAAFQQLAESQAEYAQMVVDNEKKKFDNIKNYFDLEINMEKQLADEYAKSRELQEAYGQDLTSTDFTNQIDKLNDELSKMMQQSETLDNQLKEAVSGGKIKEGSEEWLNMYNQILAINNGVKDLQKNILDLQDEMRKEVFYQAFDKALKKAEELRASVSTIRDIMTEEMMFDDDGLMTDFGITALAMDVKEYESYLDSMGELLAKRQQYIDDFNDNNNDINYSQKEFDEDMSNITKEIQDLLRNATSARKAIIDMVSKTSKAELDALMEAIDARQKLLKKTKE